MNDNVVLSILDKNVVVDVNKLRRSSIFNDLLNFNIQVIQFPVQYLDAVNVYLLYIHNDINKDYPIDINSLKLSFELCHYLDDNVFFTMLMERLLDNFSEYKIIISELCSDIQRDINLHLPYCFSTYTDHTFFNAWCKLNIDKKIKVEDVFHLSTLRSYIKHDKVKEEYIPFISEDNINYKKHGLVKIWSEINGKCVNGECEGEEKGSKNLFLEQEINYEYGKQSGINRQWYQDGKLKYNSMYLDGTLHGISTYYDEGGRYNETTPYNKGKKHGIVKRSGVYEYNNYEVHFVNNFYDDNHDSWYPSGIQKREFTKTNSMYNGEYKIFFEDGVNLKSLCHYQWDKLHGVHNTWFENIFSSTSDNTHNSTSVINNSQMATYHTYKHGKKTGIWKEWWPNGNVRYECYYLDDLKHGYCEERNQDGEVLYRKLYVHGKRSKDCFSYVN